MLGLVGSGTETAYMSGPLFGGGGVNNHVTFCLPMKMSVQRTPFGTVLQEKCDVMSGKGAKLMLLFWERVWRCLLSLSPSLVGLRDYLSPIANSPATFCSTIPIT